MSDPLRPTAEIAAAVVLPDDPALALALAQRVLTKPRMANHSFGLWGYSGHTASGLELTVQSSGIGAASLVAVVDGLARHGAQTVIRVGRCRGRGQEVGASLAAEAAIASDGASKALAAVGVVTPDQRLLAQLLEGGALRAAAVAGADLAAAWPDHEGADGADVADLETAALYALAARLGIAAAAALVVAEGAGGARLEADRTEGSMLVLGEHAAGTLERLAEAAPA